ncbi:MAG: hypothetical protein KKD05_12000 [Candidatus Omnitrophica bacterium]|nr:hypothetical protein [Candidatus Omnitrophota bacterium]
MSRTGHPLFLLGKVAYYIGILLLFNFFFGLIFLRFFVWLIAGGILIFLLLGAMMLGKNMLFGTKVNAASNQENTYKPDQQSSKANNDVIDVEAEIFDDNKQN